MSVSPVVFTNGCFDLLHLGHIRLLEYCASRGRVVVGLNSDESVSRLKGPHRPISPLVSRKSVLESIRWVDEVVVFDEDTPINLVKALMPDLLVKGGDYNESEIVGFGLVRVEIFPLIDNYSTSNFVRKIAGDGEPHHPR